MPGDLHTHSSCSDGSTPIEKLPWLAACAGLDWLAISDQPLCALCLRPPGAKRCEADPGGGADGL